MTEETGVHEVFALLKRKRRLFAFLSLAFFGILLFGVFHLVPYRATATIQIERAEVPSGFSLTEQSLLPQNGSTGLSDTWIATLREKLFSTASLSLLLRQCSLCAQERGGKPLDEAAAEMAKRITLELVGSPMANPMLASRLSAEDLSAVAFKLSFDSLNPYRAKEIARLLALRFIDEDQKERLAQAQSMDAFLGAQLAALSNSLAGQEKRIASYRKAHGIDGPEDLTSNPQATEILRLNLQNIETQMASDQATIGSLSVQLAGIPPYAPDPASDQNGERASSLGNLKNKYAMMASKYGPDHPDLVKLRHEIESLKAEGHTTPRTSGFVKEADNPAYLQIAAPLHAATAHYNALADQRDRYRNALQEHPEIDQEINALLRDYESIQLRYREVANKKLTAEADVKRREEGKGEHFVMVEPPILPLKTHPPRIFLIFGGLLLSLLFGAGATLGIQALRPRICGARYLQRETGRAPLVSIPLLKKGDKGKQSWLYTVRRWISLTPSKNSLTSGNRMLSPLRLSVGTDPVMLPASGKADEGHMERNRIVAYRSETAEADLFRQLRTQILRFMESKGGRMLAITSPRHGEGKSFITVNLGLSIALDLKQTVLLADLDLRHPTLHRLLGAAPRAGLADHLLKGVALSDCLIRLPFDRMSLLGAGTSLDCSSELLASPPMRALAEEMKTRYADRLILCDMPPMLEQDDMLAFLPQVDAVLLVVRDGVTRLDDLNLCLHLLSEAGVAGIVLNAS